MNARQQLGDPVLLDGESLTVSALARAAHGLRPIVVAPEGLARMQATRCLVEKAIADEVPVYGLTTGLGSRVTDRLPKECLAEFSNQTIRGRAHAVGTHLPDTHVRAAMIVRLNTLLKGAAAASLSVAAQLETCIAEGLTPVVGEIASIGAGDLVWNATWVLALMGEGPIRDQSGKVLPGAEALAKAGIAPLALGPRDGLALSNNASFSAALASLGVSEAESVLEAMQTAAALSIEGFGANLSPLNPKVLALRFQPGQAEAAAGLRARLRGSRLEQPGAARRLQDPLSIRNLAQVHGAAFAALAFAREASEAEINGASDNPAALVDEGIILSGGAYHTPHLTNALELLSRAFVHSAITQLARLSKLLSARFTELPLFLARPSTSSNGFAPVMKTAEALATELVHAAAPAPLWPSICAEGVEDSMTSTPVAGKALLRVLSCARRITAIELMVGAQAIELRGVEPASVVAAVLEKVRALSPPLGDDRALGTEIEALAADIETFANWQEEIRP